MLFTSIRKTEHYKQFHEDQVPWSKVVDIILTSSKNMRKKGDKIEIDDGDYYILCELKNNVLWVINAKRV